ncbi:hypothetical protein REPUB_Repub14bG0030400 [Reevesia pubescens]
MAEDLERCWSKLTLTEEEKDNVVFDGEPQGQDPIVGEAWLVGKLLTTRSFNKEAMVSTFRVVWRLVKDFGITFLDDNLFLLKERVLYGSSWTFDKYLLALKGFNRDLWQEDYVFDEALFWVRIYGLPFKLMSLNMA